MKIHIAIGEYEFVEVDVDDVNALQETYRNVKSQFEEKEGHNIRKWAQIRDRYLNTGELPIEDYEGCNKWQKFVINEFKKTINK